jgi:hypothetical protein
VRVLASAAVVLLLAGCVGEGAPTSSLGPTGTDGTSGPITTIEDFLLSKPHLKVLGPATIQWNLDNATATSPEVMSTLFYFGTDVPSSHHGREGGLAFAAFIPINATAEAPVCGSIDPAVKHFLRNFGGGPANDFGNLTGDYLKGWYHFIAIADAPGSFSISFDTEKELRNRKLPEPDPFVANIQWKTMTGAREYHEAIDSRGVSWLGWAQHQIGAGGGGGGGFLQIDGGRRHTLGFNDDCAGVGRTGTSPNVSTQNEQHRLRAFAMGTGAASIDAVYTPQQPAAAPQSTLLHFAAVAISPIELPAAPAPTAS